MTSTFQTAPRSGGRDFTGPQPHGAIRAVFPYGKIACAVAKSWALFLPGSLPPVFPEKPSPLSPAKPMLQHVYERASQARYLTKRRDRHR